MSTVLDETLKIAVTRFDDRIRVGGMAQVVGYDLRLDPSKRATLEYCLEGLFPGAGDLSAAKFWTGLRPMTPDSTPVVGATQTAWLVAQHRTRHTWDGPWLAGQGQLIADLVSGTSWRDPRGRSVDCALSGQEHAVSRFAARAANFASLKASKTLSPVGPDFST